MFEKFKAWRQRRKDERIDHANMEAILNAAWHSGRPIAGTVDDNGVMNMKYADCDYICGYQEPYGFVPEVKNDK